MDEIKRLQKIIDELTMLIPEFAKSIDISKDTIYNILSGKTKISLNVKNSIYRTYPNLNRTWFETGEGEMFTWKHKPSEIINEKATEYNKTECRLCNEKDAIIKEYKNIITQQRITIDGLLRQIELLQNKIN